MTRALWGGFGQKDMKTDFEWVYNSHFRGQANGTQHMADCEAMWDQAIAAERQRLAMAVRALEDGPDCGDADGYMRAMRDALQVIGGPKQEIEAKPQEHEREAAAVAAERERWQGLRDKLASDTEKPRWGLHGHSAVDDDYFLALAYAVDRMDELLGLNHQTGGSKQERPWQN